MTDQRLTSHEVRPSGQLPRENVTDGRWRFTIKQLPAVFFAILFLLMAAAYWHLWRRHETLLAAKENDTKRVNVETKKPTPPEPITEEEKKRITRFLGGPTEFTPEEIAKCDLRINKFPDTSNLAKYWGTVYNGNADLAITSIVATIETKDRLRDYSIAVHVRPLSDESFHFKINDTGQEYKIKAYTVKSISGVGLTSQSR